MKGLLIKDWYMILKQGKWYLVFNVIYSVLAVYANTPVFFVLFNVLLNCMMVKTLIAYEEQNRWGNLCIALPVTANEVVWEKYIVGAACAFLANMISFTVIWVARMMGQFDPDIPLFPLFLLFIAVALLYLALELPILFRFGAAEGRIWFIAVTAVAAGLGAGIGNVIIEQSADIDLTQNGLIFLTAGLAVLTVGAVLISGKISVYIYNKKEL